MIDAQNPNDFEEVDLYEHLTQVVLEERRSGKLAQTWPVSVIEAEQKATAVAVVVVGDDGSILVTARHNDFSNFGLPGGKIEPGETARNAAIRECFEETGIQVRSLIPVYARRATTHYCVTYLVVELAPENQLKAGHKECTPLWINSASLFMESCHYRQYNTNLWAVLKKHGLIQG